MIDKNYIKNLPPWQGNLSFHVSIPPIRVDFQNLDSDISSCLKKRYCYFEGDEGKEVYTIQVLEDPREFYIAPRADGKSERYKMETLLDGDDLLMWSFCFAGWFNMKEKKGQMSLSSSDREPKGRSFENYLRVLCAWAAIELKGFLIHGASILKDGKVHIFFGPSAAGKSTLAEISKEGDVISDDLTIIIPSEEGLIALGSPFRGTYEKGKIVKGKFPVVAFYRIIKDDKDFIEIKNPSIYFADIIANIPFVVDKLGQRRDIFEQIRKNMIRVPVYYLHFSKKGNFWRAIEKN